jgi:DHA2 family multidrug resistance protein
LRTEGTALLSLVRNVGSAIGISVTGALLTQNTQIEHSVLTAFITPLNRLFQGSGALPQFVDPGTAHGASVLNSVITQQAQIIAYADDFKLMMLTSLPMLLLLLLMKRPPRGKQGGHAAAMD